jgi:hypothetical protein
VVVGEAHWDLVVHLCLPEDRLWMMTRSVVWVAVVEGYTGGAWGWAWMALALETAFSEEEQDC